MWPDEKRHRETGSVESEVEIGAMPVKAKGDKGWSATTRSLEGGLGPVSFRSSRGNQYW